MERVPSRDEPSPGLSGALSWTASDAQRAPLPSAAPPAPGARAQLQRLEALARSELAQLLQAAGQQAPAVAGIEEVGLAWDLGLDASELVGDG